MIRPAKKDVPAERMILSERPIQTFGRIGDPIRIKMLKTTGGFTLLELVIVIFIISLFLTLTYPSLSYLASYKGSRSPHRLLSVIRLVQDSAINTREELFIRFEFQSGYESSRGEWATRPPRIVYTLPEGSDTNPAERRKAALEGLVSVRIPSRGEVREGKLTLIFGPFGYPEPFEVLFTDGTRVLYNPYSGRTYLDNST